MSDEKKGLVPKLRFPEFRNSGEWSVESLQDVAYRVTVRNGTDSRNRVLTNSAEYGVVDQRDYFDKDIADKRNLDNYFVVSIGDYVYNPRTSSSAPVGPISKNYLGTGVMSPLYTVFRFNNSENEFFAHYFKSAKWHQYLRQVANVGARHDRMSITTGDFMAMPLPMPEQDEQQKIADCLSSLDELIAAHTDKLDALKTHKKGLLQQLFPREDETVPRLRFPEFQISGEWEMISLDNMADVVASGDLNSELYSAIHSEKYCYPVYSNSVDNDGLYGYYSSSKYPEDSVTITARGTLGVAFFRSQAFMGIGRLIVVSSFRNLTPRFFKELWNHLVAAPQEVTSIPQLTAVAARATRLPIPDLTEQQKIANCLSSLDDRIAAQADKIEALKQHKKGLLQQLFPAMDEAG